MEPPLVNPFATRFTQPGRLAFFFPDGESVDALVATLHANGWRGEIVGPHGTGKTTLLTQVLEALTQAGQSVGLFTLHGGQRRLPRDWQATVDGATLVAVDGYEQLGWWSRRRLKSECRHRGAGLLVTAHSPTGLPALYRTRPSLSVARHVIAQLLPSGAAPPSDDELTHLFDVFHGNVREVLFALYDRHEASRR